MTLPSECELGSVDSERLHTNFNNTPYPIPVSATLETPPASTGDMPFVEYYDSPNLHLTVTPQTMDFDTIQTTVSASSESPSTNADAGSWARKRPQRGQPFRKKYNKRRGAEDLSEQPDVLISPFSTSHSVMDTCNKSLITDSLLQIYHDVLENNLGCWLAEATCPYKMRWRKPQPTRALSAAMPVGSGQSTKLEWGTVWSNRMYRRVKRLDRVSQHTKMIRLTEAEEQAASKALNMVIMAFSAQWSQVKKPRTSFSSVSRDTSDAEQLSDSVDDFADEFEHHFQYSIWEQAKEALDNVANLECFRVVYAELIFGLIQRPWLADVQPTSGKPEHLRESMDLKSVTLARIMDIISHDGPPIYMDRATRKMRNLKFQFEARESGFAGTIQQDRDVFQNMTEERHTIGLLYWLAVMFDTVSSSMNERPVALADEYCQHDDASKSSAKDEIPLEIYQPSNHRWNLDLFAREDSNQPLRIRWPCSYDVLTDAIARSAAVKVLLFRYVSYLQNSLTAQERGQPLEDIIQNMIKIYRYWNLTHGALFRDLIKYYDSIPTRIKSWFPCIHIPWNLGVLMLADLMDFVDKNRIGVTEASQARLNASLAERMRKSSAIELADLAKATVPQENSDTSTEQLTSYHFAVNKGAVLMEPWTVLLVRAFTKAALFHLGVADDLRQHEWVTLGRETEEFEESLKQCNDCINALSFLGRKSSMAWNISRVLAQAVQRQEMERAEILV